ncbi:hypothetical protein [Brevundimonas sp. Root1423]|uniref:hypothetical protein n=1 Tax=Brevundimonas sp. Root1423 TaxID=1736462 RepID=UPI0006FB940D|nr:hypothetical protein [Brevundimonas sp. Root1423]KQY96638.1 hypothetical protein ASD25_01980 [Brevundimonas sp. Root1423]
MTRQSIGENLAARLYAAETAIDLALIETAMLAAELPAARADAYLSAVTGQRAFDGAAGALSALSTARSQMVQTHTALAALARKLGLDALAMGPVDKPGDTPPVGGGGGDGPGIRANMVNETLPNAVNKTLPYTTEPC